MRTLTGRLNFSSREQASATKIHKWSDVNYYDTLCLMCAEQDIDLSDVDDNDFDCSVSTMASHGQDDKTEDYYYVWIDEEVNH